MSARSRIACSSAESFLSITCPTLVPGKPHGALGSRGAEGRHFLQDIVQAKAGNLFYAFLSGAIFNLSNILLVTVISIAGMAIAFPIGVGLALVLGVIFGYLTKPIQVAEALQVIDAILRTDPDQSSERLAGF